METLALLHPISLSDLPASEVNRVRHDLSGDISELEHEFGETLHIGAEDFLRILLAIQCNWCLLFRNVIRNRYNISSNLWHVFL